VVACPRLLLRAGINRTRPRRPRRPPVGHAALGAHGAAPPADGRRGAAARPRRAVAAVLAPAAAALPPTGRDGGRPGPSTRVAQGRCALPLSAARRLGSLQRRPRAVARARSLRLHAPQPRRALRRASLLSLPGDALLGPGLR